MSSPLYAGEVHYCGDDRQLQACDCKDATVTLCRLPFFTGRSICAKNAIQWHLLVSKLPIVVMTV